MRFSLAAVLHLSLCALSVRAASLPRVAEGAVLGEEQTASSDIDMSMASQHLDKRAGATAVVIGIAAVKGAAILTKIAIEIGADTIKNLGEWTKVREAFTKKTTDEMWNRNPDRKKFPAVACYNKGYHLQNPKDIDGKLSAKVELGLLHTDYDCMYIAGPNQFYTHSEGGYINLAYRYDGSRCSFDQKTGDLTCK